MKKKIYVIASTEEEHGLEGDVYHLPVRDHDGKPLKESLKRAYLWGLAEFQKKHPELCFIFSKDSK